MSLWLVLVMGSACAPKPVAPGGPGAAQVAVERPLLAWRIERDGVVDHLVGTCHAGISLDDALPQADALLGASRLLVTEADTFGREAESMRDGMVSDGPRLHELLEPDAFRAISVAVAGQLPASLLDRMQPWTASILVDAVAGAGFDAILGPDGKPILMDRQLQARAGERGLAHLPLETTAEQAALLSSMNAAFLAELGPTGPEHAEEGEALRVLCAEGDLSVAASLVEGLNGLEESLLTARNRAWLPKLRPELERGGVLVAVGAAHLLGDDGLLASLAAEGYVATRLTTSRPAPTGVKIPGGAVVLPAPPLPADYPAVAAAEIGAVVDSACAPVGMLRACVFAEEATCRETVRLDATLCVEQLLTVAPDGTTTLPAPQAVGACAGTGALVDAWVRGELHGGGQCAMLKAALDAQGSKSPATP